MKSTPEIFHKLTKEAIEAFPIATSKMSVKERRELCVSFFRFCQTWCWTPDRDLDFQRNKAGAITNLKKGTVYGGFPYGGLGSGNVYRMLRHFYDPETGVIKMDQLEQNPRIFCNQCSLGSGWAWRRVVSSANRSWTESMTQKNGYLPVGPYTYKKEQNAFSRTTTKDICEENGEQVMYQSYAALKPGDGLVMFTTAGHVIMCSSYPAVCYKKSGEINPQASYFTVIDQGQRFRTMHHPDNEETFVAQGGVDRPLTFEKAFEGHYLPFTFEEFQEGSLIPESVVETDLSGEKITAEEAMGATVKANRSICDVYVVLQKGENTETVFIPAMSCSELAIPLAGHLTEETLAPFSGGSISVECQLGNGEYLVAYKGMLR